MAGHREAAGARLALGPDFEDLHGLGPGGTPDRVLARIWGWPFGDAAVPVCSFWSWPARDELQLPAEMVLARLG